MEEFGKSLGFWDEYGASGWGEDGTHTLGGAAYQARKDAFNKHVRNYYTDDLITKVYNYFKEDFDRFGFTKEEILVNKAMDVTETQE